MKHFEFISNKDSFRLISKKKSKENETLDTGVVLELAKNVKDFDKRAFLKVLGIAGIGLAATSLFPKKVDALVAGSTPTSNVVGIKNDSNTRINPATEETLDTLLKPADLNFDGSGYLNVNVQAGGGAGGSSFSDIGDVSRLALVDENRNVQVDIVDSSDLQKINFGGFKFALRMATISNFDYVGEAPIGSATSSAVWRIKRIDNTSGIVITWAGTGAFDQVWDNYPSHSYS